MGLIRSVIPECETSDLFETTGVARVENAYRLSHPDRTLRNVVLLDVFHHIRYPGTALAELHRVLAKLARIEEFVRQLKTGIVLYDPQQDRWSVPNFTKRQARETNTERSARYRQRTRNANATKMRGKVARNKTNSAPDIDIDTDVDSEKDIKAAAQPAAATEPPAEIESLYTQSIGSEPTPAIREKLALALRTYPAEWIPAAFAEAASYNGRSWAYVEAILHRWKTPGRKKTPKPAGQARDPQRYTECGLPSPVDSLFQRKSLLAIQRLY